MPFPLNLCFAVALVLATQAVADRVGQPVLTAFLVIGTALWVYFDGKRLQLARYRTGLVSPEVACIGCFLLWIVAFPWYLSVRYRIRNGSMPLKEQPRPPEG